MFPVLGFLLKDHKIFIRNVEEVNAFIKVTFIEHLKALDRNDQRSFIDAFLVKQQEVIEAQQLLQISSLSFENLIDKQMFFSRDLACAKVLAKPVARLKD